MASIGTPTHGGLPIRTVIIFGTLGVLGISASGPIMAATMAGSSVTALALVFWRTAIGTVAFAVPVILRNPGQFRSLGRREFLWSSLAGMAQALQFITMFYALTLTSVAACTALVCLQGGWIALFHITRGCRLPRPVLVGLGVSFTGVIAITGFDLASSPQALLGDGLSLLSGILAGICILLIGKARETMSTGTFSIMFNGVCAALAALIAIFAGQPLAGFEPSGWAGILAVTVMAQLLGTASLNHLVVSVGPLICSMLVLLEIPGAALLAALFLGEILPPGTYAGLALILAGIAVVVLAQNAGLRRTSRRVMRTATSAKTAR
ncbi:DMT family transporter [Arthrobacter sp. K5]|uniref:DMT family transporter n=1 Tax=Arthrobacter sp. K5 TaxID=2839623 RepID=A0AAU8EWZ2_9MICC